VVREEEMISGQGIIKLSPQVQMGLGIFVLVQKDSNDKKESFSYTDPKRLLTKFTTRNRKNKKENQSFVSRQLCVSLNRIFDINDQLDM